METEYSLAVKAFQESDEYKTSVRTMEKAGMVQPYINNILERAFAAGWNNRTIEHKVTLSLSEVMGRKKHYY